MDGVEEEHLKNTKDFLKRICAPFVVSFGLEWLDNTRKRENTHFVGYKISVMFLDVLFIMILTFLWLGENKSSIGAQIIICFISLIYSFYMYCISEMSNHYDFFKDYDDGEYLLKENRSINKTRNSSENMKDEDIFNWRESHGKNH